MKRLLLGLCVVFLGCASLVDVGTIGRRIELVQQRTEHDCGLASLAMLLGEPYERLDRTRILLNIDMEDGLYAEDVQTIAGAYHVRLEYLEREPNPTSESGIVVVQPKGNLFGYAHAVYLYRAYIYDPGDTTAPTPYVMAYVKWDRVYYFLRQRDVA